MAERRKDAGRRKDSEPEPAEEDEFLDADEPRDADDEARDADDEVPDAEEEVPDAAEPDGRDRPAMTAGEAAKVALRQIATLTTKQPEGVTGIERTEDGWTVGVEIIEDERIPSSADILATYETTIDGDGELLSYRRVRRYARGRGDAEDS